MRLAGFLDPDLVKVPLVAESKADAVSQLLDLIAGKYPFLNRNVIEEAIAEREEVENTSMGRGFAFPHARSEGVDRMYIAVGVAHQGIPGDTPDGERLHVVVLLLTPRNIARLYLQTLSAFMRVCRSPGLRHELFKAPAAEDVLRLIWESGVMVQDVLSARDIMRRPVISVRPQNTLKEVANLLYRHRISGMPVVNDQNQVVGEISERELIQAALSEYPEGAASVPIGAEPFEALLKRENDITVADLMTPPVVLVEGDTSVVELAALMLHRHIRRVIVVRGGKLSGLIMRSDIVSRVIRG